MKELEILAPCASFDGMKGAINAGCDAVYIGGEKFSARAFAKNPDNELLTECIHYAHKHNKRIYLTVNTLLNNHEVEKELTSFLQPAYMEGIDGVIVQDFGVLKQIHMNFPDLPIHASTQMTLYTAALADQLKRYHVTRIVTPRELSLEEIRRIKDESGLEIETFVHGALCYCYSGQCSMSKEMGNRSGNRGSCAQPCRKEYEIFGSNVGKGFFLSPKDLMSLEAIPDLIRAGVDSFKIEGRMKKPEYAAFMTSVYRKYLAYFMEMGESSYKEMFKNGRERIMEDIVNMQDIYNRGGFTGGFFYAHNHKDIMSMDRPNHQGTLVGDVESVNRFMCKIHLKENVNPQDVLEIRGEHVNRDSYEFTLKNGEKKGGFVETRYTKGLTLHVGQKVYRTRNNHLLNEIRQDYLTHEVKIPIKAKFMAKKGSPLEFYVENHVSSVVCRQDPPQIATNLQATESQVIKQLTKLGNTPYIIEDFEISLEEGLFIPNGALNELRRDSIQLLEEETIQHYQRILPDKTSVMEQVKEEKKNNDQIIMSIKPDGIDMLREVILNLDPIKTTVELRVYLDLLYFDKDELSMAIDIMANEGIKIFVMLPHVLRYADMERLSIEYSQIIKDKERGIQGFVIRNFEGIHVITKEMNIQNKEILADYNLYATNEKAIEFLKEFQITGYTLPLEWELEDRVKLSGDHSEAVLFTKKLLMVSANCFYKNTKKCDKNDHSKFRIKETGKDKFTDVFQITKDCRYCYNLIYSDTIFDEIDEMGHYLDKGCKQFRLDFNYEDNLNIPKIMKRVIANTQRIR